MFKLTKYKKTAFLFFLVILFVIPIFLTSYPDNNAQIIKLDIIKPKKIHAGNRLKIEGSVKYLGPFSSSLDVVLLVNGTREQTRRISISSYQTMNISFFWTPARKGAYLVSLRIYNSPTSFEDSPVLTIQVNSIAGHQKYTMALYHFNVQYVQDQLLLKIEL